MYYDYMIIIYTYTAMYLLHEKTARFFSGLTSRKTTVTRSVVQYTIDKVRNVRGVKKAKKSKDRKSKPKKHKARKKSPK